MKKILLVFLMAFVTVTSVAALAPPQQSTLQAGINLTADDKKELVTFAEHWGSRMKFLELERSLMRNNFIGEKVVEVLQENHPDANLTKLITILDNLEALLSSIRQENFSSDAKNLSLDYLGAKRNAINYTHEFRIEAHRYLTGNDTREVRSAESNLSDQLKGINDQIRLVKRQLIADRMNHLLARLGINKTNLINRIREGNATRKEVALTVSNFFKRKAIMVRRDAIRKVKALRTERMAIVNNIVRHASNAQIHPIRYLKKAAHTNNSIAKRRARVLNASLMLRRAKALKTRILAAKAQGRPRK